MPRRSPFRDPLLILQVLSVAGLQWFAADAGRVERWYSRGFYPPFSSGLRAVLGWLPFSAGDLLYGAAVCFLAWRLFVGFRWAWRRQLRQHLTTRAFVRAVKVLLSVYLIFQVFWGLNYSRPRYRRAAFAQPAGLRYGAAARACPPAAGSPVHLGRPGRLGASPAPDAEPPAV
jgi:hypothetical protein